MPNTLPVGDHHAMALIGQWLCFIVVLSIGLASGFQSIHEKFESESHRVLATLSGFVYWLSRGIFSTAAYFSYRHFMASDRDSLITAISCGLSFELLLRSRFHLGERKTDKGSFEVAKGLFDLVKWYQFWLLKSSGEIIADERRNFNERQMTGQTDVIKLCNRARVNAGAWPIESEKKELIKLISQFQKDFESESKGLSGDALQELHRKLILEFGYAAMRKVRRKSLKTLLA